MSPTLIAESGDTVRYFSDTPLACYGYRNKRFPHPVAAKKAEGRTKSRLIPDPVKAPTVTYIFHLRVVNRLGYRAIADVLNANLALHPPPTPVSPERAVGRWTYSAVRDVLCNPKYTGYMVWNRRATTSKKGKRNPPSKWVWSPRPTHEPLVTKETYRAAHDIRRSRQGSRAGNAANSHPKTKRTCPVRHQCTNAKAGRVIVLHPHHGLLAAARAQADTDNFDTVYRQHRPMIERTIAWLVKDNHRRLRYRGTQRNRLGWSHRCAAVNLKRLLTLGLTWDNGWATT